MTACEFIHRSYPQGGVFHVKHDVKQGVRLWMTTLVW